MEKCPFCGEELDALSRRISELESQVADLSGAPQRFVDNEATYGESVYWASSERSVFHRPSCKWATYLEDSINLIEFDSHEEAVAAGYKPCKTCCA